MKFKVLGIGEVLWDLLPEGPQLGGAPANFACHAKTLGAQAQVVTRVGKDDLGRAIVRRFVEMGIGISTVQMDDDAPTGTAVIRLQNGGVPEFVIQENVAWDRLAFTDEARQAVQEANALCFGSLAQRRETSALTIRQLVAAASPQALKVFDLNLRQKFYTREIIEQSLDMADVLKLNDYELAVLAGMLDLAGGARQQIEHLAGKFGLRLVALTRGDKGSLLFQTGRWSDLPGSSVPVVDTVGAGDSFAAALVMGLLNGLDFEQVHRLAAAVSSFVCSRPGATPNLPARFRLELIQKP